MNSKLVFIAHEEQSSHVQRATASLAIHADRDEERGQGGDEAWIGEARTAGFPWKGIIFLCATVLVATVSGLSAYSSRNMIANKPPYEAEGRGLSESHSNITENPAEEITAAVKQNYFRASPYEVEGRGSSESPSHVNENPSKERTTTTAGKHEYIPADTIANKPPYEAEGKELSESPSHPTENPAEEITTTVKQEYYRAGTIVEIQIDDPIVPGRRTFQQGILTQVRGDIHVSSNSPGIVYDVVTTNDRRHYNNVPTERVRQYTPYESFDDTQSGTATTMTTHCDVGGQYIPCLIVDNSGFGENHGNIMKGMYTVRFEDANVEVDIPRNAKGEITIPARRLKIEAYV